MSRRTHRCRQAGVPQNPTRFRPRCERRCRFSGTQDTPATARSGRRGPTAEPDRRLDYIFSDASLAVIDAGLFKDLRAPGMDHDPLVGDLHFVRK